MDIWNCTGHIILFFILFFKLTFAIQIQTISNIQIPILLQFDCFVNGNAIKMSFFDFDLINLLKSYIISNSTGHPRVWVIVLVVVAESSSLRKTRNRRVRSTDLGTYVKKVTRLYKNTYDDLMFSIKEIRGITIYRLLKLDIHLVFLRRCTDPGYSFDCLKPSYLSRIVDVHSHTPPL